MAKSPYSQQQSGLLNHMYLLCIAGNVDEIKLYLKQLTTTMIIDNSKTTSLLALSIRLSNDEIVEALLENKTFQFDSRSRALYLREAIASGNNEIIRHLF